MDKIYDLIIIGSGPAGLSASLYAARYKLDHLIFGVEQGGQMNEIYTIENWPGDVSVSGTDLVARFSAHIENYGIRVRRESAISVKIVSHEVESEKTDLKINVEEEKPLEVESEDEKQALEEVEEKEEEKIFEVETSGGKYTAKRIILAMGAKYRSMNIPGEKEFLGKGVSYCATCDAMFFKNKTVCVIGGGNSAAVVALELSDFASKVYLIHKEDRLEAEPLWLEKIEKNNKIEVIKENSVIEIRGKGKVKKIILNEAYNDKTFISLDGVFIEVGTEPGIQLARKIGIELDEQDYIKVKEDMSTNISGVYAAGDITTGSNKFRQVLIACSEGAIAAASAYKSLKLK
jgi:thioredoxin reductase (NADPH)